MIALATTLKRRRVGWGPPQRSANVSTKFVKKVESRIAKTSYVDKVKIVAGGSGSAKANTANDKCTSNRLLDESSVAVLDVGEVTGLDGSTRWTTRLASCV